jgi:hypothetical protein
MRQPWLERWVVEYECRRRRIHMTARIASDLGGRREVGTGPRSCGFFPHSHFTSTSCAKFESPFFWPSPRRRSPPARRAAGT